jgi:hypothetical protein
MPAANCLPERNLKLAKEFRPRLPDCHMIKAPGSHLAVWRPTAPATADTTYFSMTKSDLRPSWQNAEMHAAKLAWS